METLTCQPALPLWAGWWGLRLDPLYGDDRLATGINCTHHYRRGGLTSPEQGPVLGQSISHTAALIPTQQLLTGDPRGEGIGPHHLH